ncbi:MAG: carbohydrate kinase [Chloroflexi bacterium]|nr:carbohydrate kinase [Chloroflexota bacterium]OJV94691.1 MAG: hypothetical protein BGO39_23515 [Chloroflexi bacterium 54-19]
MAGPGIVCLGEALVDIQPARREQTLLVASTLRRVAGGAAANVTVALTRLGLQSSILGKVGTDPFGTFLKETLAGAGVDVSHLASGSEAPTGVAFAWVTDPQTGEPGYFSLRYLSAERTLAPEDLDPAWLEQATAFQFGSLPLSVEPSASTVRKALEIASKAGIPCIYDLNLRLPAWSSREKARNDMLGPLEATTIVKMNRHELAFMTGETELERGVEKLWRDNFKLLVVTLDREGCYFRTRTGEGYLPGFPVRVADTIACGDVFLAALVAQILRLSYTGTETSNGATSGTTSRATSGATSRATRTEGKIENFDFENIELVRQVCLYANAAGALTATRSGAFPALPTSRQLAKFLKDSGTPPVIH